MYPGQPLGPVGMTASADRLDVLDIPPGEPFGCPHEDDEKDSSHRDSQTVHQGQGERLTLSRDHLAPPTGGKPPAHGHNNPTISVLPAASNLLCCLHA